MRLPSLMVAFVSLAIPAAPLAIQAQQATPSTAPTPAGPPLAQFAAMRVAILPVQFWRADSIGWSRDVAWASFRTQVDSAIAEAMRERGMGTRWAYAPDVIRTARRNPMLNSDPLALGAGRWRAVPPEPGEDLPPLVADNLRLVTALGDTRYALIPVELRASGDGAVLRLVLADTRVRTVVWIGDLPISGGRGLLTNLGARVADLIVEP